MAKQEKKKRRRSQSGIWGPLPLLDPACALPLLLSSPTKLENGSRGREEGRRHHIAVVGPFSMEEGKEESSSSHPVSIRRAKEREEDTKRVSWEASSELSLSFSFFFATHSRVLEFSASRPPPAIPGRGETRISASLFWWWQASNGVNLD